MDKTKYLLLHWLVILLWIVCIFSFSAQPAKYSNGQSLKVTKAIVRVVTYVLPVQRDEKTIERLSITYNGVVRKAAHATIYFLLGILVARTLRISGVRGKKIYLGALLFCFFYADSDEMHQVFVGGRSGQVSDVLLDTSGAAVGIVIYWCKQRCKKMEEI